jgi:hypothetical protein
MSSTLAEALRREQTERVRDMSAEDRLAMALELGERAIGDSMRNFGVDRRGAVAALRRAGRAGRRFAACMEEASGDGRSVRHGG